MPNARTLIELLTQNQAQSAAIRAPGRKSLTFDGLKIQVTQTMCLLEEAGIMPEDRVAIVLPNGPEMASAFLSVASYAVAAPLNPAYQQEEFAFYLSDIKAKAIITSEEASSPILEVAKKNGIPLIYLKSLANEPAGIFTLSIPRTIRDVSPRIPPPENTALILHTSGTTSKPKIVPLSHINLCASAHNISNWLNLKQSDVCLNIMPLFHIHGLIAAVLSSLYVGGSVACTPGFNALQFFSWLNEIKPTWYTAVPTMHQAILSRADRNKDIVNRNNLNFIRSSSSSLPVPVMEELERTFCAPVIESYGMTEATHQMTSNPLPPQERRPGCVGVAAGPEVKIMDTNGKLLGPDKIGEVVIRGDNVTRGYENNDSANIISFNDGWFRTGDQGKMDSSGYLTLTGRLKEIINRGGEKISPREVDDVLITHPSISQVVVFSVPHKKLGEDVAAAIVLRKNQNITAGEIREFLSKKLAAFKIPNTIVFLDEIPTGSTGKLQRIGLAEKLGLIE